jgi:plasmid replication initiation protein
MLDFKTGDRLAVMANTIAESRHSLTVPEQRLILWLVAQIEREEDCFREHILNVLELEEILGGNASGTLYAEIEAAVKRLQTRVLEIRVSSQERVSFNWLHEARYFDGEGKVRLRFHDNLKPLLLCLKERFCQIPLKSVFRLRGGYAVRWLEMLYSRRHKSSFALSVEELRDWLHVNPGDLETVAHLRSRAIDLPKRELDQKSDLSFSYKPKKEGRRIIGWTFTVRENKPKAVKKARRVPPPAEAAEQITPERITLLKQVVGRKTVGRN